MTQTKPSRLVLTFAALSGAGAFASGGLGGGLGLPTARASTLSDFRLRPSPTPTERPAGPVDSDNPFVNQAPHPQPSPAPPPPPPPPVVASPVSHAAQRAAGSPQPEPGAPQQEPQNNPRLVPETPPSANADYPLPQGLPAGVFPLGPRDVGPASVWWEWLVGGVALLGALALGWWLGQRRGRNQAEEAAVSEPAQPAPTPPVRPVPAPLTRAEPAPAARPVPPQQPAQPAFGQPARCAEPIAFALQAVKLTATLVNAVLDYRISLINGTGAPLSGISLAVDMIGVHGQAALEDQLRQGRDVLPARHIVECLESGKAVELRGEIRLPLNAIVPLIQGNSVLFVPAVRLCAKGFDQSGKPLVAEGDFLVGQPGAQADRLQPFRLDLGPRTFGDLAQRPLTAPTPAWPARMAATA